MTDRPILFNGPMVRAVLAGTKTRTRRLVKLPPPGLILSVTTDGIPVYRTGAPDDGGDPVPCPLGAVGDKLWVRECFASCDSSEPSIIYRADGTDLSAFGCYGCKGAQKWRPSIHMPRWASRITLAIEHIRVERLQDITEEDARAEGVEPMFTEEKMAAMPELASCRGKFNNYLWHGHFNHGQGSKKSDAWPHQYSSYSNARDSFSSLWASIYGSDSWDANPLVWVCEFRKVTP